MSSTAPMLQGGEPGAWIEHGGRMGHDGSAPMSQSVHRSKQDDSERGCRSLLEKSISHESVGWCVESDETVRRRLRAPCVHHCA